MLLTAVGEVARVSSTVALKVLHCMCQTCKLASYCNDDVDAIDIETPCSTAVSAEAITLATALAQPQGGVVEPRYLVPVLPGMSQVSCQSFFLREGC